MSETVRILILLHADLSVLLFAILALMMFKSLMMQYASHVLAPLFQPDRRMIESFILKRIQCACNDPLFFPLRASQLRDRPLAVGKHEADERTALAYLERKDLPLIYARLQTLEPGVLLRSKLF